MINISLDSCLLSYQGGRNRCKSLVSPAFYFDAYEWLERMGSCCRQMRVWSQVVGGRHKGHRAQTFLPGCLRAELLLCSECGAVCPFHSYSFIIANWSFLETHPISAIAATDWKVEADMKIQLPSIKPDIKQLGKSVRQCHSLILFWRKIFEIKTSLLLYGNE